MSKNLKASLIEIGYKHPNLRPDLRLIIAASDYQELFGELRSSLAGKKNSQTYEEVLKLLVQMHRLNPRRVDQEVVPYVHKAIEKFPESVRTYDSKDLKNHTKPESKFRIEFAKVYTDRTLSPEIYKSRELTEKVLLNTKAKNYLLFLDLRKAPLSNKETIQALMTFPKSLSILDLSNRNMPSGTLFKMKAVPDRIELEGNPKISLDEISKYKAKHPQTKVIYDHPDEEILSTQEIYGAFTEELRGMFNGPSQVEIRAEGAPMVSGSFGLDAPEGRAGRYTVALLPMRTDADKVEFHVSVQGEIYSHQSTQSFPRPKSDVQSTYDNRHVTRIVRQINDLLYDIMKGN